MKELSLFEPTRLGPLPLRNRLVMAPMSRNRTTAANVPTALMVESYGQRSAAGLIVHHRPRAPEHPGLGCEPRRRGGASSRRASRSSP